MKYKWTIICFLLGLFTRRPPLIFLGLLIGIAMDSGLLRSFFKSNKENASPTSPDSRNSYEVLEVDSQASDEDIEDAYRRQMAQYHPDKVAGAAKEIRQLAEKRATEINAAYDHIQKIRGKK